MKKMCSLVIRLLGNVVIANSRLPELFGKRVFCQKHETPQELGNKAGNIINWRNNGQRVPLRNDIRVNPAECADIRAAIRL